MKQSGRNRWQLVANRTPSKTAQTRENRCRVPTGCRGDAMVRVHSQESAGAAQRLPAACLAGFRAKPSHAAGERSGSEPKLERRLAGDGRVRDDRDLLRVEAPG